MLSAATFMLGCLIEHISLCNYADVKRARNAGADGAAILLKIESVTNRLIYYLRISMFHRAFFNSIIDKTRTHALFIQHYISL